MWVGTLKSYVIKSLEEDLMMKEIVETQDTQIMRQMVYHGIHSEDGGGTFLECRQSL